MSDGIHLLIPFASTGSDAGRQAQRSLALPRLQRLLARLAVAERDAGEAGSLSMPHERVLAREYGLQAPDGCIPWAAWQVSQSGRDAGADAWAWITPCHWKVGTDHVAMAHPQDLQLDGEESRALLQAMQPYFEQDGIALEYDAPTLWLARGEVFRALPAASLDRAVGRVIDPWMPRLDAARGLRRLQQEMQMLLYTHPINEARQRGGLLPVNSFWISGTGALPPARKAAPPAGLQITHYLRNAALREDWPAWTAAWNQLDGRECARLLAALDRGEAVALTLCGERHAHTFRGAGAGLFSRLGAALRRPSVAATLEAL